MKKYIVCMGYASIKSNPCCVGSFDDPTDALVFAQLSRKTDPNHHYAVFAMFASTESM